MVKSLFAPAFWLLGRLSFRGGYLLVGLLFLLPLAVLVFVPAPREALLLAAAALAALAVYVLGGLGLFMSLGIERLIRVTDRVASGELVTTVHRRGAESDRHDSARLWHSIMKMNESLASIVRQVRTSAESIAVGAHTIADGNTQLAERTQEQAASLEETASGMEQLASSARQNAENCARATQLATASTEVAAQAARQMQDAAATMKEIDASSRRVGEILSTVEGIAFQTNILALNAAIEAARAGHQGRGFAVVAGEVRSLAQRSAEAAREIQALVTQSASSVQKGRSLVGAAESTMTRMVSSVDQVTQVIATIAQASTEQSAGIEEIGRAITQVDTATQHNAALVEESAGAAEAFQREARQLVEAVDRFKTDRSEERGRVVALIKAAAEHLRKHGVQRACADFSDKGGGFVRGEHYVVALDLECKLLAFAPDPSKVGNDDSNLRDADGRYFSRNTVALAKTQGSGWSDYRMLNPRSGRVEPKSMYFERVGEVVLGCGIYRTGEQGDAAAVAEPLQIESSWPRLGAA
jgi:methyl-accepting chemotaxis protein